MRIDELVWDDWNVDHIADHGVEPEEVEEVCKMRRHIARRAAITPYGLTRYRVYGRTYDGRYLFIVLDRLRGHSFYPVTARDMAEREKKKYRWMMR